MGQTDFNHGYNDPDYKTTDPPTYDQACMGLMVCPHCGKSVMCGDIHNSVAPIEQGDNMIPRGNGTQSQPQRTGRKRSGLRYLTADMLSATHQIATVVDARVQPDNFRPGQDSVVVKLKFKGEFILWTLRSGNPSLEVLGDAMGDDESSWKGHDIELYIEEDSFDGKKWIRSEVAPSAPTTKSKR
jgi:hypothetical protein